jgi:hypothetical protein
MKLSVLSYSNPITTKSTGKGNNAMNLVIKTPSDLALFFDQEPAPFWGARQTMLDDKRLDRTIHTSELPIDRIFSAPHPEFEEIENFDLNDFLNHH